MPRQKFLPVMNWPPADRIAWEVATRVGGILDDSSPAGHLATVTRDDLTRRYGYFLSFAKRNGHFVANGTAGASISREAIGAYIAELESYASSVTICGSVRKVFQVCHWIAPERDWSWLRQIASRLDARQRPRNKRPRITEVGRLYKLGFCLMDAADQADDGRPFRLAIDYRDGLIIALLAACPLRRGNFTNLELDRTLIRVTDSWLIHIPQSESKTRRLIEIPVPNELGPRIERYVRIFRPRFPNRKESKHLWLSRNGRALSDSSLFHVVTRRTREAFGHSVNPHLFRDCAVTTIALHHGAQMGAGVALLGHRDPRTTGKYYNQADMVSAVRDYQTVLADLALTDVQGN